MIQILDLRVGMVHHFSMPERDRIFLTPREGVDAIRADFSQYGPQKLLFLNLCPLIFDKDTLVVKDDRGEGVWMALSGLNRRFMGYPELGEHLCAALERTPPPAALLADVCRQVFRTAVYPGRSEDGKDDGLWIETGMEHFRCRRCGRCCRTLMFHTECRVRDYALWESIGRKDIMDHVSLVRRDGKLVSCRIWVKPGTREYVQGCPWLRKIPDQNRYECGIRDVRPEICRQYPGTRKHAEMTGCIGFKR